MTTPDLSTRYLGLRLRSPLVPSASPLSQSLDNLRRMEDAGAGAVVLPSLFEEQIVHESLELDHFLSHGTFSVAEALTFMPEPEAFSLAPDRYLTHVQRASEALDIPVIASLNGTANGPWIDYARQMQEAGAAGLELNLHVVPVDPFLSGSELEDNLVETLRAVKRSVTVPVAVKLSPYYTNLAFVAQRLDAAQADGLVLFNRFQQPDIDLAALELVARPSISPADDDQSLRLPLCWIGILAGHLRASLAASSGVHSASDVLKLLLVGADVTMLASELMLRGIERLAEIESDLVEWLTEHEYRGVGQLQGRLSQSCRVSFPGHFERAQYVRAVATLGEGPRVHGR